jgi:replicative DNA helicase
VPDGGQRRAAELVLNVQILLDDLEAKKIKEMIAEKGRYLREWVGGLTSIVLSSWSLMTLSSFELARIARTQCLATLGVPC